jgi:hypothetical protein
MYGASKMSTLQRHLALSTGLSLCVAPLALAQVSAVDGSIQVDDPILPLLQEQFVNTQFGDNTDPDPFTSNGSELCGIYATVSGNLLYVFLPGNLESNYNKLELFLDFDDSTGQNVLRDDNPDVDFGGLNAMGGSDISGAPGLTFDDGFSADYYITIGMGFDAKGANPAVYANASQILSGGGGVGGYLGSSIDNSNGIGGLLSDTGIEIAVNNSNIAGVGAGEEAAPSDAADGVNSGIEIVVPLSSVAPTYVPGSGMRICAFINNSSHISMSNQVIGPLNAPASNLGESRLVNFKNLDGCQFVAFDGDETKYRCAPDDNGGGGDPIADPLVTVDGNASGEYGEALIVQDTQTGFGNASDGLIGQCNGSELDAAYGFIDEERINLVFAGNLESNFNKLQVFFDFGDGGQNQLRGDNPDTGFNGLNIMGDDGTGNGLTFDEGFEANLWFSVNCGGEPVSLYANLAEVLTDGGGSGTYVGSTEVGVDVLQGLNGVWVALDNSNVDGVDGGDGGSDGSGVTTGLEASIPLELLVGYEGGPIRVCAFIASSDQNYLSNQVLGGIGGGANLEDPRTVDFSVIEGDQFFTVEVGGGGNDCLGDLDGDLFVGGADLTVLLAAWGSEDPTADLDGDGLVLGPDLTILLGNWATDCK